MSDTNPHYEFELRAIEVMTAWLDGGDDTELMRQRTIDLVEHQTDVDALTAAVQLSIGLGNICGLLLVKREREQGVPIAQTLQELGIRFASRGE